MMRRRIISQFKRSEGEISTLAIQRQIRLVPNDDRVSDRAPSFRVMLGWHHIGDAWERTSHSEPPREYLRLRIDDPFHPISAMLFPEAERVLTIQEAAALLKVHPNTIRSLLAKKRIPAARVGRQLALLASRACRLDSHGLSCSRTDAVECPNKGGIMALYKRAGTYYLKLTAPDGTLLRRSTGTTDRQKALEYHDKLKARLWDLARLKQKPKRT
jgi:excisionase family DNA binding protein